MIVGDATLLNTKIEVSMPGFMKIDYLNQVRKGEKIGGGGCAAIYKGVILDRFLREVSFSPFLFFLFHSFFFFSFSFFLSFFLLFFFFLLFISRIIFYFLYKMKRDLNVKKWH